MTCPVAPSSIFVGLVPIILLSAGPSLDYESLGGRKMSLDSEEGYETIPAAGDQALTQTHLAAVYGTTPLPPGGERSEEVRISTGSHRLDLISGEI